MYHVQMLGRPSGLGEIAQGRGGYQCGSEACWSFESPQTHQIFLKLQTNLNLAADQLALTFKPLIVDGKIGKSTADLAKKVATALGENYKNLWFATILEPDGGKYQTYAKYADVIVQELAQYLGGIGIDNASVPTSAPLPTISKVDISKFRAPIYKGYLNLPLNVNAGSRGAPMGTKTAPGPAAPLAPSAPAKAEIPKWAIFTGVGVGVLAVGALMFALAKK